MGGWTGRGPGGAGGGYVRQDLTAHVREHNHFVYELMIKPHGGTIKHCPRCNRLCQRRSQGFEASCASLIRELDLLERMLAEAQADRPHVGL